MLNKWDPIIFNNKIIIMYINRIYRLLFFSLEIDDSFFVFLGVGLIYLKVDFVKMEISN